MEQANQAGISENPAGTALPGQPAGSRAASSTPLPPLLGLILEFAAFASVPLLLMGYLIFSHASSNPVLLDLNGVWKTQAPGYADRYMEISDGVIMFGTGGDTLESYVIDKVETRSNGARTLYTLTYLDRDRNEMRLSFYYESRGEPLITFKHQAHLTWTQVQE